jgi:hypothetical protein
MSDKPPTPNSAEGARRRKRPAPTIDLTATDVSAAPPAHESDETTDRTPADSPEPQHEAEPAAPAHAADDGARGWNWRTIRQASLAGIGGALAAMIILVGLWYAGLVPTRFGGSVMPDTASVSSLNERMARIEAAAAKPVPADPGIAERLSAADNAVRSLGIALAALNKRNDEIAARADATEKAVSELRDTVQTIAKSPAANLTPADVDTLQRRLTAVEQAVKGTTGDRAARLALAAAALRDAVIRGGPFSTELEEAKSLGAQEKNLAALVPFAANGVPGATVLAHDLRAVVPAMVKAAGAQAPAGSFLDRLQANAGKLVRIRPTDAPPGDDVSAVLARIEVEAARLDIDGALADLGKLDTAIRAPAREWIAKAQARQAAIAAAHQFAADSMRALGRR